ncbi:mechanosensitive ion channel domain-containing protein [Flavobacterium columnare]|uniref:Mechanosensitive ion channel n=1 Tax=Flavobacterium columnare TaxID=996 RepID=A0AAI8CFI5_9FLAO|nr:mechanosensitive ion channel domain-containing protein [Flavobacterium columnare]AMO19014.1 mechanosensitive ion channel [Flavobacterium columnare]QOG55941.1 mechanosensitive ion channel [Flavobacterium columnare]QOG58663.1 mechanosensitive ion channel [Flavobacterium columnare]QOG61385.1 mechanosensitive ion channel [Flavobacterium columnare]QOG64108.1 mechanosensitive ion channel [Flavobacterium columnare]
MGTYKIQILETIAALVIYIFLFFFTKNIINNTLKRTYIERTRRKISIKALHLLITIVFFVLISGIWGLEQNEIALFASSILTALGVAFFAQWSLLSNITSSLILFFNHPLKLGDTIRILDKDFPLEGEIIELTYFFVYLKTADGQTITIPNSLILQKSISIIEKPDTTS